MCFGNLIDKYQNDSFDERILDHYHFWSSNLLTCDINSEFIKI